MRNRLILLPMLGMLALPSCVPPPEPPVTVNTVSGNPNPPPPPVRAEEMPKPPVSEEPLIWQPGQWDWQHGAWVLRGGHGTEWQDGYWSNASGRWVWQPAHWL